MAVNEFSGFLKYKDADGNINLLMPITNVDSVAGMDEIQEELATTVKTTEQTLTDAEKTQARTNIGAASSWNDLADRPIYATTTQLANFSNTNAVSIEEQTTYKPLTYIYDITDTGIIEGNTYIVNFDGVDYECVAKRNSDVVNMCNDAICLGNHSIYPYFSSTDGLIGTEDTGEPFLICYWDPWDSTDLTRVYFKDTVTVFNISVNFEMPKLNAEYLPDNLATTEYVDNAIAAIPTPDVSGQIDTHNISETAHSDIRLLIEGLTTRLNALADSDDTTLDQMSEIVAYIKSNKTLIENITSNKVNVSDIIDNLTTNISNKPLSAAQGVALKGLIDALDSGKLDASALTSAIDTALAQAKESGEFNGSKGETGPKGDPGTTDYNKLENTPIIPASVSEVEHQYAVSNSKDSLSDVETWTQVISSLAQRERSCIFANGYYVVCGLSGEVGYSKDGINWTKITPFYSKTLTNIAYGKGKYIITDEDDGLWVAEGTPFSWTKIDVAFSSGIGSLTYANNRFIIAGDYMCAFSDDGLEWTEVEAPGEYNQIAFGGGRYVAIGAGGAVGVSYDGITWADCSNSAVTGDLRGVVYAKGKYFIGGIDGIIMYTEDFVTWGIATSNSAGVRYVRNITYAENKYYAACYTSGGAGEIWTSLDGITWTVQQQMNVRLWCLSYNDGKLISAGDSGSVYILDLGIVWRPKQADLVEGQYLWERIVCTLSDGDKIISDAAFIKAPITTADIGCVEDTDYTTLKVRAVSLNSAETTPTLNGAIAWTYE